MQIQTPNGDINLDGTAIRRLLAAPPAMPGKPILHRVEEVGDQLVHEIRLPEWPEHADAVHVYIQGFNPDGPQPPYEQAGTLSPGDLAFSHATAISPIFNVRFVSVNPVSQQTGSHLHIE